MKILKKSRFLQFERVVAATPVPGTFVRDAWSVRLNYFTGRTLTKGALDIEQHHHETHLALLGRQVSWGVVTGLDSAVETLAQGMELSLPAVGDVPPTAHQVRRMRNKITVSPGRGLTAAGEDVVLVRPMEAWLEGLPVVDSHGYHPYEVPRGVGVLVLQPISFDYTAGKQGEALRSLEQCELHPEDDPYDDRRSMDGCRLAFFPLPPEIMVNAGEGEELRNSVAFAIFKEELRRSGNPLPWEENGVAVALVAIGRRIIPRKEPLRPLILPSLPRRGLVVGGGIFGSAIADRQIERLHLLSGEQLLFVDRHAVVRQGGSSLPRRPLRDGWGTPYLWQSRMEQFNMHLHELYRTLNGNWQEIGKHLRFLPPVGVLPPDCVDVATSSVKLFPATYRIDISPVPDEQLETAMEKCAALAPFDLGKPDRVRILVPVPQRVFEPRLLEEEEIDPAFDKAIDEVLEELALQVGARSTLRGMATWVAGRLDAGRVSSYPAVDPARLPGERNPGGTPKPVGQFDAQVDAILIRLVALLRRNNIRLSEEEYAELAPHGDEKAEKLRKGPPKGLVPFIRGLEENIARSRNIIELGHLRLNTEIHRVRQVLLGTTQASVFAASPSLSAVVQGETARAQKVDNEKLEQRFLKVVEQRVPLATMMMKPMAEVPAAEAAAAAAALEVKAPVRETKKQAVQAKAEIISSLLLLPVNMKSLHVPVSAVSRMVFTLAGFEAWLNRYKKQIEEGKGGEDEVTIKNILARLSRFSVKDILLQKRFTASKDGTQFSVDVSTLTNAEMADAVDGKILKSLIDNVIAFGKKDSKLTSVHLVNDVMAGLHDPDPDDEDEAGFLAAGVNALDTGVSILEAARNRVAQYEQAVEVCREASREIEGVVAAWQKELAGVDNSILELRHDLTFSRALKTEEEARVAAINRRRAAVLREHVRCLFFLRPRTGFADVDIPAIPLQGDYPNPLPAALLKNIPLPDELKGMLKVLSNAPLGWLTAGPDLLRHLDTRALMLSFLKKARERAMRRDPAWQKELFSVNASGLRYAQTIQGILAGHGGKISRFDVGLKSMDLSGLERMTWRESQEWGLQRLSLRDVMEHEDAHPRLVAQAGKVLEEIGDVAAALLDGCRKIEPVIRLQWADMVSVFDRPVMLDRLSVLPGWDKVGLHLRSDLQQYVSWLFSRIVGGVPEAADLVNDLVRICILLASHAPAAGLVQAHLPRPFIGIIGDRLNLVIKAGIAAVGMEAIITKADGNIVRGVVDDLVDGGVQVRLTVAAGKTVSLDENDTFTFMHPSSALPKTRK